MIVSNKKLSLMLTNFVEKFKIMNPNKIPCTVNFKILKTESKTEGFAFEVSPQ